MSSGTISQRFFKIFDGLARVVFKKGYFTDKMEIAFRKISVFPLIIGLYLISGTFCLFNIFVILDSPILCNAKRLLYTPYEKFHCSDSKSLLSVEFH